HGSRKGLDDVDATHDSDEPPIEHHRQSTDVSAIQDRSGDLDAPDGADRVHPFGHHLTNRRADRLPIVPSELFTVGEKQMPPRRLFPMPLANDQIALADDTDETPFGVDDRQATHPVLHHQARGLVDRRRGTYRDHAARHDVFHRHRPSSLSLTISPSHVCQLARSYRTARRRHRYHRATPFVTPWSAVPLVGRARRRVTSLARSCISSPRHISQPARGGTSPAS